MERIRQLRTERGLSQAKLAVMAEMDPATLNRLEQGKGNPNLRTLERVADALGVGITELLGDEAPKARAPLPFEEEQRRSPFLEAWTSYMRQRAEAWRRELEEEGDELFGEPEHVFEALDRNEQVQTEATMLLSAVFRATIGAAPPERPTKSQAAITAELGDPDEEPRKGLTRAIIEVMRASREWSERTGGAWAGAVDRVEADKLARAKERAEEAIRKRENVVAMFPMREIA